MYHLTDEQMKNVMSLLDRVDFKGLKEVLIVSEIIESYNEQTREKNKKD